MIQLFSTELLTAIHDSYTPHPTASLVDGVLNFKTYFEPYLNKIEGHSKYSAFRFLQSDDLGVEMHYKQSSSDPWEPTKKVNEKLVSDKGLRIIQVH